MDILIKNMEMPTKVNHPLFIRISSDGHIAKGDFFKDGFIETDAKAVALPEHGRLGDLDAIRESLSSDCPCRGCERFHEEGVCMNCQWDRFAKLIDEAPTVLEASNE